jgi:spore coat polysaccharide biosynthesis protein SpsF
VAVIQARMGSTRLPGKVLLPLAGEPMLSRTVKRATRATSLCSLVVATTDQPADNAIVELCQAEGWICCRGSEEDVLDRYYRAAVQFGAEAVVRLTSDCPLTDPEVVDQVVHSFLARQPEVDYASNFVPERTYPRGLDVQVIRFDALERAWREDTNPVWRADVTYYIDLNPDRFCIHNVVNEVDYSEMRWTVDTADDMAFACRIYDHFGHDRFSWREVVEALGAHPEWHEINRHVEQKTDLESPI